MRAAPAITVFLPGSRRWSTTCSLLGATAAAAAIAAACDQFGVDGMMSGLSIAAAALAGALLSWRARPPDKGRLRWDGARWWFCAAQNKVALPLSSIPFGSGHRKAASLEHLDNGVQEQPGSVMVMMDWGRWMLLCFKPATGSRWQRAWLPVSDRRVPQIGALRAAAYGRSMAEPA